MELRIRSTGQVMFENEFRTWLLNNNGPSYTQLTPEIMETLGVDPVFEGPQAQPTTPYEFSMRQGVKEIGGKWFTNYVLGPIFSEYTDSQGTIHTIQEQESEYKSKKDLERANMIRNQRNQLLKDSDWTQVLDAPINRNLWAEYRQQLRNVPNQPGFPWNIVWPEQPG
jgi:hypothetical protein